MLTQLAFNQLSHSGRLTYMQQHGRVLFSKETLNHKISLLQINDFFVEIWYNLHMGIVDSMVSYKNTDLLEKFTDSVDLDDLLS